MSETNKFEHAKATFDTLCRALDKNDWHYKKDEDNLSISCGAQGDDLPIELSIDVEADRELVILISHLPFVIPEDKRLDTTVAISAINNVLADGCFDYNVETGRILFRMTNSFAGSKLSEAVFEYLLYCSCKIIDEYNDKFFMLSKGMLTVEKFLESLMN